MASGPHSESSFHRFEDDYLTPEEWGSVLNVDARVALALGIEPIEDARHLLAPIALAEPAVSPPPGPNAVTAFVVDFEPKDGQRITGSAARELLPLEARATMDFPQAWAGTTNRAGALIWTSLDALHDTASVTRLTLAWPLADLLSEGAAAVADLRRYTLEVGHVGAAVGLTARAREGAEEAARRASRLLALKRRFGHSIEMRLLPAGKPFASRDIWRAAYGIGLTWGDLDLFHWYDTATGRRLFTLSALGQPGYFLPERAAEGERVPGIALSFELPYSPAPLAIYDRMAVTLAYLRQKLGGRPIARDGAELDGDRLYDDRDALEEAITEMERAGIPPGSPEAARFF